MSAAALAGAAPGLLRGRAPGPPPLLDLLGAAWAMDAPVVGVAWDGGLAGFGLGDGSLATARAEWDGAPHLRPREGGGVEMVRGTQPPPPVGRQSVHDGACLSVAADAAGGFLSGGADGVLAHTGIDGAVARLGHFPGLSVDVAAAGAGGSRAGAVGRQVHLSGPARAVLELPGLVTALAFDATGTQLAVAHDRGVTLWSAAGRSRALHAPGCPRSMAWSPDGAYVVCGLQENALHGWQLSDDGDIEMGGCPGQPRSLAFTADGRFLASSGAARVICWRFDPPDAGSLPIECGLSSSRMPVCRVACHPVFPLIAAGYHNGAVLLCQPGTDDVLFARGASGDAVSALAWSADGGRLAIGTESGEIGVVALPGSLFRFDATSSRAPAS